MEPVKLFAYSYWTNISRLPDIPENYSIIQFTLTQADDLTILSLTHRNLIAETAYEHANFYWNAVLDKIKKLVENQ